MRTMHQMRDDQSNDASYDLSQGPMGLFSFRKKDAEAVPPKRGSRRSGRTGTRTAGGGEYSEHEQLDPLLPEKQRARRRLVGALALVLAAVIILPMVLAPEPKPAADDIAIQIPGKDANSPPVRVKPQAAPSATPPSDASLDKGEEALDSSTLAGSNATKPAPAPAPTAVPPAAAVAPAPSAVPEPQVAQAKPEHKPDAKPDVKKPEQHAETKPAAKPDSHDTAKAQARPDNSAADPIAQFAQNNTAAKSAKPADSHDNAQKPAASGGKYLVRIGAFSTQDRAQAWLVKLKLVNVPSYMVKSTVDGRELYLLRAGPFSDRPSAEAAGKKIRDAGLTAQVAEAG
ncbi:SPOR domain-containing protein [Pandoraea fibrosis]|uniref:SPOR domain-containing protein n=1 Tax=Pandoraea fibrosis TaxID=1891094 RepID=A0ABX6HTW8_9BURK|nr:SPOR domain-containing protein [Pandoraea fibrosis]QHE92083.1 SPOR domain-containing protein [Pandoraea fibrosis]QHF14360.1 SPOR domain-containing protein [Pandoraea fibrosis]